MKLHFLQVLTPKLYNPPHRQSETSAFTMARRSSLTAALGEGGDAKWWEKAIEEEEENKTPWRALVTEDGLDYYMNVDTQGKKNKSLHTLLLP